MSESREALLERLRERLLAPMMDSVNDVLTGLSDEDLRALDRATGGDDPVAQALAERFVFRKAAEVAMRRASAAAKARAAAKRDGLAGETPGAKTAAAKDENRIDPWRTIGAQWKRF